MAIHPWSRPKTVDAILAAFTTTIQQLEDLSVAKSNEVAKISSEIDEKQKAQAAALAENARAVKVAAKLKTLLAE